MNLSKLFGAVISGLLVTLFYGGALLLLLFFGLMGAFPLYVTQALLVFGPATLLAAILWGSGCLGARAKRYLCYGVLAVCAGCAAWIGAGLWRDSLATVDDRELLLRDYEPFREDSRLAALDEPASLHFDSPYDLRLDGATALYPVYAAFVQAVYPEVWPESGIEIEYSPYDIQGSTVLCTGTIEAYDRLITGQTDMIFAAAPSQDQLDRAAERGVELRLTPIGREAFVFFVNSRNPVTGLTVEEVRGIYAGQITNWSEVGGRRESIRPFQRAENSGSQSALERLMDGLPLREPEEEDRISAMDGIIREVASYRNYRNAIGFSFRFYAEEMVQSGDIRLLALDGVEPTRETIRNGSYPIASDFYAVTAAPAGDETPLAQRNGAAAAFLDWILSEQGQALIERTGYVEAGPARRYRPRRGGTNS